MNTNTNDLIQKEANITMLNQNLFEADIKNVFAHCIGRDGKLGAGIAVSFEAIYPGLRKFIQDKYKKNETTTPGIVRAVFYETKFNKNRVIYNLITKEYSREKPTIENLEDSLILLKEQMIENDEKFLAIPKIGSGLDKLSWEYDVIPAIKRVFMNTDIEIKIYYI